MRAIHVAVVLGSVMFAEACGRADDEGYCVGPFGEALGAEGVPACEGTACVWARNEDCREVGGEWIDYVDTEFDYASDDDDLAGYCASQGYPVNCSGEGISEVYVAAEDACTD